MSERAGGPGRRGWRWGPPQRWAVVATWVAFVGGLAPVLWRVHMMIWGAGWPGRAAAMATPIDVAYLIVLELLHVGAAVAGLGLVQRWGERLWGWVPKLGGRWIPRGWVLVPAILGAVVLTTIVYVVAGSMLLVTTGLRPGTTPIDGMHGWPLWFFTVHYAPALLWPPALWLAIAGYWRRSRRPLSGPARPVE